MSTSTWTVYEECPVQGFVESQGYFLFTTFPAWVTVSDRGVKVQVKKDRPAIKIHDLEYSTRYAKSKRVYTRTDSNVVSVEG